MRKGIIIPVMGGQFGSEGKGAVVTALTRRLCDEAAERPYPLVVRIGGPNAGHTGYDEAGRKWVTRTVPIAAIDPRCELAIAQGSEIEMDVLEAELAEMACFEVENRLYIDGQVTMLEESHKEWERSLEMHERLGSTAKGIGAARSARLMRTARLWKDAAGRYEHMTRSVSDLCREHLDNGGDVIIETSQGYGLGLHAGFYPYCTSVDCTASDALAAVGLPPNVYDVAPWIVLRTFPIRVAGNSGPLFDERTWEELGRMSHGHIKPELTTVTKKIRRIGGWDIDLARAAIRAAGNCSVALTFLDYLHPDCYEEDTFEKLSLAIHYRIGEMSKEIGTPIRMVTTGPATAITVPDALYTMAPERMTYETAR